MKQWTVEEFKNPPAYYRGAPFWAWNNRLDQKQLVKQIACFKEMGMGGFHIHCRVGLDTPYLGEEFMEAVSACEKEGERLGLYTYLYDEDRWPSGAAGGLVTKDKAYRSRHLLFVPAAWGIEEDERRKRLARYRICLEEKCLKSYTLLRSPYSAGIGSEGGTDGEMRTEQEKDGENIWELYLEIADPTPWHNNQTYVDTLNKKAVQKFIEITHEAYYELLGEKFGREVPSIFTDEPQFHRKETLNYAEEKKALRIPYTDGFEAFYRERFGEEFLERFPEVIWELPGGEISSARYQYHEGIAELFSASFADTIGGWCEEHGLMLTGHMMEEPTLLSQTSALGEAMRSYRSFQQPGIDMLCDWREYTTAKQAQSAAHQYGRQGVLSELYGVTNWDFDFRGHKLQGDWQAALGVTRRVPHLSWASMEGEAKRDYPASIFYQSPWYREYKTVEDHFARVNTAMMDGKPIVHVAVIHPIESYWLHFGPKEQTAQVREALEQQFREVTEWLLFGTIDFDFLAESLLAQQPVACEAGRLLVGCMVYDAVLVPGCDTLRNTTLRYLEEFAASGGEVIFAGKVPEYIDARKNPAGKKLAETCKKVSMSRTDLLNALESFREVEIRRPDGKRADQFLYQMRKQEEERWIFIANGRKPKNQDLPERINYQIRIKGEWNIVVCDTLDGMLYSCASEVREGWTSFTHVLDMHDSLLLYLLPVKEKPEVRFGSELHSRGRTKAIRDVNDDGQAGLTVSGFVRKSEVNFLQPQSFVLEEENVLLLDQCEYCIDDEEWQEYDELLRIDNKLRERFGYPKRMEAWPQPWVQEKTEKESHRISLRFCVQSEISWKNVRLALENVEKAEILWNGQVVEKKQCGWYVDESIHKIELGDLLAGENVLIVRYPWGERTNLEWMYLLGEFGVRTAGRNTCITRLPEKLCFGDYTVQGLPFYTGNVRYFVPFEVSEGSYGLQISYFRSPLLKVSVDGGEWQQIAYAPYEASLGKLSSGLHTLEIICYGNRFNGFGAVHCCDETEEWMGPNAWRTEGERYSYEYQLKRAGILKTPVIYREEKE